MITRKVGESVITRSGTKSQVAMAIKEVGQNAVGRSYWPMGARTDDG